MRNITEPLGLVECREHISLRWLSHMFTSMALPDYKSLIRLPLLVQYGCILLLKIMLQLLVHAGNQL